MTALHSTGGSALTQMLARMRQVITAAISVASVPNTTSYTVAPMGLKRLLIRQPSVSPGTAWENSTGSSVMASEIRNCTAP